MLKIVVRDGRVVYEKKNGTVAKTRVLDRDILTYFGFPSLTGRVKILHGEPITDSMVVVETSGDSDRGLYLVSNNPTDKLSIRMSESNYAKRAVLDAASGVTLADALLMARCAVLQNLAGIRGMKVWQSAYAVDEFWNTDYGQFHAPDGWTLLPRGDGALTRKVRKENHWIVLQKVSRYTEELGTLALEDAILAASEKLGGDVGAEQRMNSKLAAMEKREDDITNQVSESILRLYPGIPASDLTEVLEQSRSSGHVGRASCHYFGSAPDASDFDRTARLAVRAHVRHQYTDYDKRLDDESAGTGRAVDPATKEVIREQVDCAIREKLALWQKAPLSPETFENFPSE